MDASKRLHRVCFEDKGDVKVAELRICEDQHMIGERSGANGSMVVETS